MVSNAEGLRRVDGASQYTFRRNSDDSERKISTSERLGKIVRQLNIDWLALVGAFQMNMPEVQCYLCVHDGHVLKLRPGDRMLAVVRAEPQAHLQIPPVPSIIQYQWVDDFIIGIPEPETQEEARTAINGKGAFRRFKDILLRYPEERKRWFEFRDERMRERVMDWILEQGITPLNDPPWEAESLLTMTPHVAAPVNSSQDIEALRDFLVDWADNKAPKSGLSPITLETLAEDVAKRFVLRPFSKSA